MLFGTVTPADQNLTHRTAGTLSNAYIKVVVNSTTANSTAQVMKNSLAVITVTITSGTTGEFENVADTTAVAAGDELQWLVTAGSAHTLQWTALSCLFDATTNTVARYSTNGSLGINGTSVTRYIQLSGGTSNASTEANAQMDINTAGTLKNLYLFLNSNLRGDTCTFLSRINGANGNLSISIPAGVSGVFEDTVNSDTIAANDLVGLAFVLSTGSSNLNFRCSGVDLETTNNKFFLSNADPDGLGLAAGANNYSVPTGENQTNTTEANSQVDANIACTVSNVVIYISTNGVTGNSTVAIRKNGADTAVKATITGSTTGWFEDTDSDTIVATDEINYHLAVGTGGTSLTVRATGMTIENMESAGALVDPIRAGLVPFVR